MSADERSEAWSRANISQRWRKIDERVINGLYDLWILYGHYPKDRRRAVFDRSLASNPGFDGSAMADISFPTATLGPYRTTYLTESLGFVLLGFMEQMDVPLDDEESYELIFQRCLERVLWKESVPGEADIDVDVCIDGWTPGGELPTEGDLSTYPDNVLRALWDAGEISGADVARAITERDGLEHPGDE